MPAPIAPIDTSSFTPAQMTAFDAANALGSHVPVSNNGETPVGEYAPSTSGAPVLNTGNKGPQSNAQGVIVGNAPTGSQLSANGNFVDKSGTQYTKGPANPNPATLTANITTPSTTPTGTTAPAAISSKGAATDLTSKTGTLSELNANATAQATPVPTTTTDTTGNTTTDTSKTTPAATTPVDDAIAKILSELDTNLAATKTSADTQTSQIDQQIADNSAAETQAATDAYNKLNAISSGTYPLSPAEQQLLDSTKASFAAALQAQQTANSGALGQMQSILATLGLDKSAPMEAAGFVFNTISTGATKLADIGTKMAAAVSKVQVSLQQNDFKSAQTAWADMAKTFTDRTAALTKLQTNVTNAAKAAQTASVNYAKTAITGIVNSDKVDMTAKSNLATEAYHSGLLSAKNYANVTARIKANNNGVGTNKGTPAEVNYIDQQLQSTRGADGYVDPNVYKGYFDQWMAKGYTASSFFANFPIKAMTNPANTWLAPYLKSKVPTGTTIG